MCQILLHQLLANPEWRAAIQEDRRRSRVLPEILRCGLQHVDIALVEHETVARIADRRRQQLRARQRAVFLARIFQAGHGTRHAHREIAVGARALDNVTVFIEIHVRSCGQRRLLAEVQKGLAAVGQLQGHETATAKIARRRIYHGQCITHRHRCIHRIAAGLQHIHADMRRQVLRRHHHAVFAGHRGLRGSLSIGPATCENCYKQESGKQSGFHGMGLVGMNRRHINCCVG